LLTGTLATPLGSIPFSRFDSISDSVTGFGDLIPQFALRWNAGVNNYMTYVMGDIPVGAYQSTRLANTMTRPAACAIAVVVSGQFGTCM
jgi:hypothetical protein